MQFVRDVGKGDIAGAYREGFVKNSGAAVAKALAPRIDRLISWMSDMKDGDAMSFTFLPGQGVEVSVKGRSRGTIAGDDFSQAVLSLWLGPHPPNAGLKEGLLGKK